MRLSFFCRIRLHCVLRLLRLAMFVLPVTPTYAAGTGMPWEAPLQQVLDSVQGPVAKIMAVAVIVLTGLTLAFGETAGGFLGGMARAAGGTARSRISNAIGFGEAVETGRQAAWTALNPRSDADGASSGAAGIPAWAQAMKAQASARHHRQTAAHAVSEGSSGGAGAAPDIDERND